MEPGSCAKWEESLCRGDTRSRQDNYTKTWVTLPSHKMYSADNMGTFMSMAPQREHTNTVGL